MSGTLHVRIALAVVLGLLLAACSTQADQPAGDQQQAAAQSGPTATETTSPTASGARTVVHAYGTTDVPADPQRVVVLHSDTILATALRVGVPVVATAFPPSGEGLVPYLPDDVNALEDVGWLPEFDLEKIAALEPDLIIGNTGFIQEQAYPKLQEIAPTVAFEMWGSTDWKKDVRKAAAAFGRVEEIEDDITAFEQRVEQFRAALGGRLEDVEVTLVQIRGSTDDIRIHTNDWCAGQVLEEIGIGRPDDQQVPDPPGTAFIRLSMEHLPRLDSDAIFYWVGSSAVPQQEAEQAAATITDSPLWQRLEAVQQGRAYRVDAMHWFTCGPIAAQNLILEDLEQHLLGDAA